MTGRNGSKPDLFTPSILNPDSIATIANDKNEFQKAINGSGGSSSDNDSEASAADVEAAASRVSELIAKAGSGAAFEGQSLGVGGLDDVLVQIKRRIWTPLAAPPQLLNGKSHTVPTFWFRNTLLGVYYYLTHNTTRNF
jgi:hypothetical protein